MARIFIDSHMFSEEWFQGILPELIRCQAVNFIYGESQKLVRERNTVRKALEFYKLVGGLKNNTKHSRRVDVSTDDLGNHEEVIEGLECYISCPHCDDAHIFALIYAKPTPFVFSMDARMARCRDELNKFIDKRYCQFRVISAKGTYDQHRPAILA